MNRKEYTFYRLHCKNDDVKPCYIGYTLDIIKTAKEIEKRVEKQKNPFYEDYLYQFIRDNGGLMNWIVRVIYIKSLLKKEIIPMIKHYIAQYDATLNFKIKPGRMPDGLQPKIDDALPQKNNDDITLE